MQKKFMIIMLMLNLFPLKSLYANVSQQENQENTVEDSDMKYRLFLSLTPFKNVDAVDSKGQKVSKQQQQKPLTHFLRAKIFKKNHFYVGPYHVVTTPATWVKQTGRYTVVMEFSQHFGNDGIVEESLGTVKVTGYLNKLDDRNLSLVGQRKHRFVDKWSRPTLDVLIGLPREQALNKPEDPKVSKQL